MEADKLNFDTSGKIILSIPYHYDDPIVKSCTQEIKQIIENQCFKNVSVFMFYIKKCQIYSYIINL